MTVNKIVIRVRVINRVMYICRNYLSISLWVSRINVTSKMHCSGKFLEYFSVEINVHISYICTDKI